MFDLEHQGNVSVLTLCHPPANAIGHAWLEEFGIILDELEGNQDTAILHLRSNQKIFCAGADLKEYRQRMENSESGDEYKIYLQTFHRVFHRLESMNKLTSVEIGGAALGGGFELALSCDLRVAAYEAKLGLPEGRLGLIPGAGGTQRLTRLCGPNTANRIILACEIVGGETAVELGMVQWAVPRDALPAKVGELIDGCIGLSPAAIAAAKTCIAAALDPTKNGFELEIEASLALVQNPDSKKRVAAFFDKNR
jgi:enoyl-CoA hydratase